MTTRTENLGYIKAPKQPTKLHFCMNMHMLCSIANQTYLQICYMHITQKQNFHFLFPKNFRAKDSFVQNMLAAHLTAVVL